MVKIFYPDNAYVSHFFTLSAVRVVLINCFIIQDFDFNDLNKLRLKFARYGLLGYRGLYEN